ncbi:mediator complex subunit 20 [Brevipalpus obovatus]|uniref:mediator complex subunit 20 n=1 Tax=Brevipalpus obovatus TaxID=246614 RepID=UPI003D9EC87D
MGVTTVHQYPIPEGKTGQQVIDNLVKLLETLGATKSGTFCVDCETYYSAPMITPARTMNVIHNTEAPVSCFAILDTGTSLRCDVHFDSMLGILNGIYQAKKAAKMESKGPRFTKGDFTVKIGSVSIGPSFRGILIEIEYGPCLVPAHCWELLREFMASFMFPPRDPHVYLQGKMNEIFTPLDTIQQYNDYFNSLRKAPVTAQPVEETKPTINPVTSEASSQA